MSRHKAVSFSNKFKAAIVHCFSHCLHSTLLRLCGLKQKQNAKSAHWLLKQETVFFSPVSSPLLYYFPFSQLFLSTSLPPVFRSACRPRHSLVPCVCMYCMSLDRCRSSDGDTVTPVVLARQHCLWADQPQIGHSEEWKEGDSTTAECLCGLQ